VRLAVTAAKYVGKQMVELASAAVKLGQHGWQMLRASAKFAVENTGKLLSQAKNFAADVPGLLRTAATKAVQNTKAGLEALGRKTVNLAESNARFRGEPFAFGRGSRSQRVQSIVDEAARASGINRLSTLVDDVIYDSAGSYFTVINGRRILAVGPSAFGRTRAGQLLEAAHELVHAQQFSKIALRRFGGDFRAAANYFFGPQFRFGSPLYARGERVAETVARLRINRYLGGINAQQWGVGSRYISGWRIR